MNNLQSPLVSVGIPVYNGEAFLEECLESVLNQTYKNWECVIVNNCSTDKTAEIAQDFVTKDPRFKLINATEFVVMVDNWNRIGSYILKEAKYLKVLQADDWIYPESLEKMVELMEKYPSAGMCSSYRIDGKIVNCDGLDINEGPFFSGRELLLRHLNQEIDISGTNSTLLFRTSVLTKIPTYPKIFDDTDYHEDTRLFYEMMLLADVVFVYQVLSYTRWHDDAETTTTCVRYNTFLNGREERLFRFKEFFPGFEDRYKEYRLRYAYFLLKQKLLGKKKTLEWHNKYLKRKFSFSEYLMAIIFRNGISVRLSNSFRRNSKKIRTIKVNS